ncbi:MAG: hypothetical protein IJ689_03370 [Alphaproteobacteria bacterium]|nr:hypothetical protein [Alphaproteobacteria bacterium]
MADLTFEEYKEKMRQYLRSGSDSSLDITEIASGLARTFPKKPEQSDRLAMCYAYWHRSQLPMSESDYKNWHKMIKSYINESPENKPENGNALYFMLRNLEKSRATPSEAFNYSEKVCKKLCPLQRNHQMVVNLAASIARVYYDELVTEAVNMPDTGNNYQQRIKAFDKAASVLIKIPHTDRYRKSLDLMDKMRPVYMECEWGRIEFPRKCKSIRHRVYVSMPSSTKEAMRNSVAKRDWYYK